MGRTWIVGGAVAAALVVAGIGYANIPDSGGEIHACYDKQSGQMRIYDSEDNLPKQCGSKETAIDWNRVGVAGTSGASGASGPQGETGPSGPPGSPGTGGGLGDGSPCTTYAGAVGTVDVTVNAQNDLKLVCVPPPPPPPPPPSETDFDNDGYMADQDCNDANRFRNPGSADIPNGVDDDCDGVVDDGVSCNDGNPDTTDVYDLDDGCTSYPIEEGADVDADGYSQPYDCNDVDPQVSPGEAEVFNKVDDDCDALVDSDDFGAVGGP
jgi:hypothetical protein